MALTSLEVHVAFAASCALAAALTLRGSVELLSVARGRLAAGRPPAAL